jgi:glycine oxidase
MTAQNSDIIIIGGGIIGSSLAYWLANRGGASVTLLEANSSLAQTGTASFASAGLISASARPDSPPALLELIKRSHVLYPELAARLKEELPTEPTGYTELGELRLAATEAEAAESQARQRWYVESGVDPQARWLTSQEVKELEPLAGPNYGAIYHPAAVVRAAWLTRTLARAAQLKGVTVLTGMPVTSLIIEQGRVVGVRVKNGAEYRAAKVVLAAGAWSGAWLDEQLGEKDHYGKLIWPVRGQMLAVQPPLDRPPLRHLLAGSGGYAFPRGDSTVAYGATEEPDAGFEAHLTPQGLEELGQLVHNLTPTLVKAPVKETWVGLRPGSAIGRPLLGPLPQPEGLWISAGHFRSGILLAPSSAELLSEALLGNTSAINQLKGFAVP